MDTEPVWFLQMCLAGWVNSHQLEVIGFLREETASFASNSAGLRLRPTTSGDAWPSAAVAPDETLKQQRSWDAPRASAGS